MHRAGVCKAERRRTDNGKKELEDQARVHRCRLGLGSLGVAGLDIPKAAPISQWRCGPSVAVCPNVAAVTTKKSAMN